MISSQPILIWPDLWALSILSHTLLDTLREMTGWFGLTMSKGRTASCQNTNHGQTKLTWYATTAYQKGRVRHKYCQQQATVCPMRCDGNEEEITDWQMEGKNIQNKGKKQTNKQTNKINIHCCVPLWNESFICWNMLWQALSNDGKMVLWNASRYVTWIGPWSALAAAPPMASTTPCSQKSDNYCKKTDLNKDVVW